MNKQIIGNEDEAVSDKLKQAQVMGTKRFCLELEIHEHKKRDCFKKAIGSFLAGFCSAIAAVIAFSVGSSVALGIFGLLSGAGFLTGAGYLVSEDKHENEIELSNKVLSLLKAEETTKSDKERGKSFCNGLAEIDEPMLEKAGLRNKNKNQNGGLVRIEGDEPYIKRMIECHDRLLQSKQREKQKHNGGLVRIEGDEESVKRMIRSHSRHVQQLEENGELVKNSLEDLK